MKYSVPYYSDFRYATLVDEIILKYSNHNENIVDFVKEHYSDNQRVVVDITEKILELEQMIPILRKLQQEHKNMVVKTSVKGFVELREADIPYFFMEFCKNEEELYSFIKQSVSDVYVVSNLAFNLKEVGTYCHQKGVNVRVIPNMAQYSSGCKEQIPAACRFFIRPEDIAVYEPYVDICEFMAPNNRLSVLFKVYKSGQWLGDLNQLIIGLDEEEFNNTGLVPYFGPERLKCKHRCMLEQCFICIEEQKIAKQFEQSGLELKRERNKEWMKIESEINEETSQHDEETTSNNDVKISEK